jgi:hypothetical protein
MNKPRLLLCFAFALTLTSPAQEKTAGGFSRPQPGRKFEFPRDHGSHPDFRTEWWYLTGHLDSSSGQRFGFQVTFFRQAGKPGQQLYLAHTAISIPSEQRFLHEERLLETLFTALEARLRGANASRTFYSQPTLPGVHFMQQPPPLQEVS